MKQPELGRKIVELRKSKGLSQEELVEKCRLNVRTLQRIESGEVMPRGHTLRTIFEELDYEISELAEIPLRSNTENKTDKNPDVSNSRSNHSTLRTIVLISIILVGATCLFYYFYPKHQDKALIRKQIELNNEKYVYFYNSYDIDSVITLYDKWSNFKFAPSTASVDPDFPDFRGQHRVKGLYTNWKSMGKKLTSRKSQNMVISDSLVFDIGLVCFDYKFNNKPSGSAGHYFAQWHFKNGKWKIENEIIYFSGE